MENVTQPSRFARLARRLLHPFTPPPAPQNLEERLDQAIENFEAQVIENREAMVKVDIKVRLADEKTRVSLESAEEWEEKAAAATQRAEEAQKQNRHQDAKRYQELAATAVEYAIQKRDEHNKRVSRAKEQEVIIAQLRARSSAMEAQLEDMRSERDELLSRQAAIAAQESAHGFAGVIDSSSHQTAAADLEAHVVSGEARLSAHADIETLLSNLRTAAIAEGNQS